MGAMLEQFRAAGIRFETAGSDGLRAIGDLTDELRASIRAHKPAILAELAAANDANDGRPADADPPVDPAAERRRARALAMLDTDPGLRGAIVAEAGDPAIVGVAIRDTAYCELEIPAERYDAFALLALMQTYGTA